MGQDIDSGSILGPFGVTNLTLQREPWDDLQTANHDLQAANQAANHDLHLICKPY